MTVINKADCTAIQLLTADNNIKGIDHKQLAFRKAVYGNDLDLAEDLLRSGAEVDFLYPPFGNALLHDFVEKAAQAQNETKRFRGISMIKWLVRHGASLNTVNVLGNSPAILAASFGDLELFKLLFDMGCDVNLINKFGESVFTMGAYQNILPQLLKMVPYNVIASQTRTSFAVFMDNLHLKL